MERASIATSGIDEIRKLQEALSDSAVTLLELKLHEAGHRVAVWVQRILNQSEWSLAEL